MASIKDQVLKRIDGMATEVIEHISNFIKIESTNPKYPGTDYDDTVGGEGDASRYVAELFGQAGAEVDLFAVELGRENAVGVVKGKGGGRSLILNGHVDVVPVGNSEDWSDGQPWSGRVEGGKVHGRGSTDQKSGVIAMTMAASALKREGIQLNGDLLLEAVVGEEVMDHESGVSATVDRGYRADGAIVTEPTGPPEPLSVVPTSPGLLWFSVTANGKAAHSSVRDETFRAGGRGEAVAVDAIEKGMLIYNGLRRLEDEWGITKHHDLFKPGHFTIHPGVITGGPHGVLVPFIISQFCTIEYAAWFPPDEDVESIKSEIANYVQGIAATDSWLSANPPEIDWKLHWPAFSVPEDDPIVTTVAQAHRQANGADPRIGGGDIAGFCAVCDATFLNEAGIPTVVYGPGDIVQAHTVDEWCDTDDIIAAARTFALAAIDWCGSDQT